MDLLLKPPLAAIDDAGMIKLCRRLLQLPSYTGCEQDVAEKLIKTMLILGFDQAWLDEAGNVIGKIQGDFPGPKILFDGHIDTVEVSDKDRWSVDPFGGTVKDGYVFGRGASDMKGAVTSMVYGLAPLVKHKHLLHGSVFISGTVCEETSEGLALRKVVDVIQPDYVIIGEASNLNLKRGQRGRAEISVTTFGKAAHASNPKVGKNAVYMMKDLLSAILKIEMPLDSFLGQGVLELTDIISCPYPGTSVVPHRCQVTFDRRLILADTEENVIAPIQNCIDILKAQNNDFNAQVEIVNGEQKCYTGKVLSGKRFFPAWVLDEGHLLVSRSLAGLKAAGLDPAVTKYDFCTNGSYSAGIAGIPTIGFGPGREDGAHIVDECMEIKQLVGAAVGYQAIACRFLL